MSNTQKHKSGSPWEVGEVRLSHTAGTSCRRAVVNSIDIENRLRSFRGSHHTQREEVSIGGDGSVNSSPVSHFTMNVTKVN
jgi:hypothetical protein